MKIIALTIAGFMLAAPAHPQDITRVLPNGLTVVRDPGVGITVERQGPHFSFSRSIGRGDNPTASASASASTVSTNGRPAVAYSRAVSGASVRTNANGQSIDTSHARALAIGQSTSTSAVSKP